MPYSPSWPVPDLYVTAVLDAVTEHWVRHWERELKLETGEGTLPQRIKEVISHPESLVRMRRSLQPLQAPLRGTNPSGEIRLVLKVLTTALGEYGLWCSSLCPTSRRRALDAYWWVMGLPELPAPRMTGPSLQEELEALVPLGDVDTSVLTDIRREPGPHELFSFPFCCDALGLSVTEVRETLLLYPSRKVGQ